MITEQQLKADCTPELINKMAELTEGFELTEWLIKNVTESNGVNSKDGELIND